MEAGLMYALTLHRPWSELVVRPVPGQSYAIKPVENRPWRPPRELIGRRLAIHAGKVFDPGAVDWIRRVGAEAPASTDCPEGIIGTVLVVGVAATIDEVEERFPGESRWFFTARSDGKPNFGWLLDEPRRLSAPVPCRGYQKLWGVPEEVLVRMGELRAPAQRELF